MAPPMAAVVLWSVVLCVFMSGFVFCGISYAREERICIRDTPLDIFPIFLTRSTDVLDILVRGTAVFTQAVRWARRQRGKRAGALARLRKRGSRTPLPGIFLTNVNSLCNKMDELRCLVAKNKDYHSAAVYAITETWLSEDVPDAAVQLEGFQLHRADRDTLSSGKVCCGGVCFFVNESWCTDVSVIKQYCSNALEFIIINCRPFYSPHEFSSFILACVYIPPDAAVDEAQSALAEHIMDAERIYPDSAVIVLGDFNKANLSRALPKYR